MAFLLMSGNSDNRLTFGSFISCLTTFADDGLILSFLKIDCLIFYKNWTGFSWAGGSIRGNIAATTTSVTDEAFIGSNTPRSSLAMQTTTSGGGSLASDKVFTSLWRIE